MWEKQDISTGKFRLRSSITGLWYLIVASSGVVASVVEEDGEYHSGDGESHRYKTLEEAQQAEVKGLRETFKTLLDELTS